MKSFAATAFLCFAIGTGTYGQQDQNRERKKPEQPAQPSPQQPAQRAQPVPPQSRGNQQPQRDSRLGPAQGLRDRQQGQQRVQEQAEQQQRARQQQQQAQQQQAQQQQRGQQQLQDRQRQQSERNQPQHNQQQERQQQVDRYRQPQGRDQQQPGDRYQPGRAAQRPVPRGEQRGVWQHDRARSWQTEHRTWQQRGGYNGYRIPNDRFRVYFGRDHGFRINALPLVVVGGYPRFQYNGYWFSLVDPWPEYWSQDWYDNDDVYVDYSGDGYYLYNQRYPNDRIAIDVFVN